jgi:segregation and condensation protein B
MHYEQMTLDESENTVDFEGENETDAIDKRGALEAVLFTMGDPVPVSVLSDAVELSADETEQILRKMEEEYQSDAHGIRLIELDGAWQFVTKKQYYDVLIRVASHPQKPRLTDVLMETLSIIAYRQPVTKAEIERIRGVKSDHAVNRLVEYELVKEVGRLDAPGRPILFGTTERFLRNFGLTSTEGLPEISSVKLEDFREEAEAEADSGAATADSEKIRV